MTSALSLLIIGATYYVAMTPRIKTDLLCLHLLFVASAFSAVFLCNSDYGALVYSILFLMIAGIYWVVRDAFAILSKIRG